MSTIRVRPFFVDDVPSVAGLFQRIFRHSESTPPSSLMAYFQDLYLGNPRVDSELPSLVCEIDGTVKGFIGALPMPWSFRGGQLRGVIGGNFMVDRSVRDPLAARRILSTFFSGPQDFALTDTSNETGRRMWEGLGSSTLPFFSMQWLRILSPTKFAASLLARKSPFSWLKPVLMPIAGSLDIFAKRFVSPTRRVKHQNLEVLPWSIGVLHKGLAEIAGMRPLAPSYDSASLEWLISMARKKEEFGPLVCTLLGDTGGDIVGWYLYYPHKGNIGQVLQVAARPQSLGAVLEHLFQDAVQRGSVALIGRMDPKTTTEYASRQCIFFQRNSHVQVHSRNPEIVNAFLTGDAFFTRLEGEWWTRLQGDVFKEVRA